VSKWAGALLVSEWARCEVRTGTVGLHLNWLDEKRPETLPFIIRDR
jgi:hypothetical protein